MGFSVEYNFFNKKQNSLKAAITFKRRFRFCTVFWIKQILLFLFASAVESLFDVFTSLHSFDMFHYFQKKSNAMLNNVHFYWPPCGITQHVSFRFINSVIGGEKSSQNTIFESLLAPAEQHAAFLSIRRIAGISAVCGVVTMVRFIYNLHTITTTWDLL